MIEKEKLVGLEVAKLAKEKGYDLRTRNAWSLKNGKFCEYECYYSFNNDEKVKDHYNAPLCCAPTQTALQKWLREKHLINITPNQHLYTSTCVSGWFCRIDPILPIGHDIIISEIPFIKMDDSMEYKNFNTIETEDFNNYELALEQGLLEGLKLL